MNCSRCGIHTPRLTVEQRYCPPCATAVARVISIDEARNSRFRAKALDGWRPAA